MVSDDATLTALLESARAFSAHGLDAFGYVEDGDASIKVVRHAVVTARAYGDSLMQFTGAVYDGQDDLVRSSLGFSEGEFTPLDPDQLEPGRREGALTIRRAIYGGTLYSILGHFLFETVARLWHGVDFTPRLHIRRGSIPIVFHPWPGSDVGTILRNPLYRQVLAALGVRRPDIVLANIDIHVETLYYPTPLSIYHVTLHPLMGLVIDHLITQLQMGRAPLSSLIRRKSTPARIFLSRSRWAVHRRVKNEPALEALFEANGFTIVHPQKLTPRALIEMLQGAEIVASTDGSQAHLAAFCRPGTRTILIDTRPVPTQFAIEKLRRLRGFHIPVYSNGQLDEATSVVDVGITMERLIAAAAAPDFDLP